jgi:hypothetical protein
VTPTVRALSIVGVTGLLGVALLTPSAGEARPGGGSSFSSSSGGSRSGSSSSSSGSRSGSSSSTSSSSGSRSSTSSGGSKSSTSSSSSSSSSAGGTTTPTPATYVEPSFIHRAAAGKDRTERALWSAGGSPYGIPPARPLAWPASDEVSGTLIAGILIIIPAGILLFAGLLVYLIARARRRRAGTGWSTTTMRAQGRGELDAIRQTDPLFSIALFEDFLYALYAEVRIAHGANRQGRLDPYLAGAVRAELARQPSPPIGQVVIGAMRFLSFDTSNPATYQVEVEFEANYAEQLPNAPERAYWVSERWRLSRSRAAQSRAPERARVLDCPGCGAPIDKVIGGQCRHCNRVVDTGELDWLVTSIVVDGKQPRGPMLTGTTEEQGTDLPTIVDPHLATRLAALSARDRAFDMPMLHGRIALIFSTMQTAWSSLEWHGARPFLSDNLFESQRYWIEAYRRAGLRNITERARILRIDVARVTQDVWFDAITLRVYATGLDYTIQAADRTVVGGNPRRERLYSEYWTLLRGTAAAGPTRVDPTCPKCGAALQVSAACACTHCNAKVNSGAFDWVLGRIEQDEAYTG